MQDLESALKSTNAEVDAVKAWNDSTANVTKTICLPLQVAEEQLRARFLDVLHDIQ